MERDNLSPEPMITLFINVYRVPENGALLLKGEKNIRSLTTELHVDRRPTYNGERPCSPRG
jgi:hypothetical protein